MIRLIVILVLSSGLIGCAAIDAAGETFNDFSSYFFGADDNAEPPNELVEYEPQIEIEELWSESVGVGFDEFYVNLVPVINDERLFAVDREGLVVARDISNGDLIWEMETELPVSAGPGLGFDRLIIGDSDGYVVALDLETGKKLWVKKVSSEVLSVPLVVQGIVIIHTVDGRISALDEESGQKLWQFERNVPALSIHGTSTPIVIDTNVFNGFAGGKLIALRLKDGKSVWETSIAIPQGRSEIERLVDLDANPVEAEGVIYVASYQGGINAVMAADGEILWRNEDLSSYVGFSLDWRYLYVTDLLSDVWQLDQRNGASLWKQNELHQRKLTAPVYYDSYVIVGDFEGYVHWLSDSDGSQLGRVSVTDDPIYARPVVLDDIVYIYATDGTLAAFKVTAKTE